MKKTKNETIVLKNGKQEVVLNFEVLRNASMILRAINHGLRQSIIQLLEESEKMTVTEIYVKLRIEQSVASQHLAILRNVGVVNTTREGKFIFYSVNHDRLDQISKFAADILKFER